MEKNLFYFSGKNHLDLFKTHQQHSLKIIAEKEAHVEEESIFMVTMRWTF